MPHSTLQTALRRAFHIGDVLSVVTGVVLSPRGPIGVQALYEHLLGRPVSLGEAQAVHREVRAHVLSHHPALATFTAAEVPPYEFIAEWVTRRAREFGTYLLVPPLPESHLLRTESGLPSHLREIFEAQPNGGWLWAPASWVVHPYDDRDIAWARPELPASPIDFNRPKTTGLGGTGRTVPDLRERNAPMRSGRAVKPADDTSPGGDRTGEAPAPPGRPPDTDDAPKHHRTVRGFMRDHTP